MQILQQKNIRLYAIYCATFLVFGMAITGLGPIIPYLSQLQGRQQIQYSFLFVCRAVGFLGGALLVKVLDGKVRYHRILMLAFSLSSLFIFFIGFQTLQMKGFILFIASVGCAWFDCVINICIIELFSENVDMYLQVSHGAFGIGGLLGPYIVYLFEINTFTIIGFINLLFIFIYWYEPSPEDRMWKKQHHDEQVNSELQLPTNTQILLVCVMYFLIVGQESTYGGWVSSYAVMNEYSTKESATKYSSIYWIACTVFRFAFPFVKGSGTVKLIALYIIAVASCFAGLFVIHQISPQIGLVMSSVLFGMSNSILFPQTLTLAHEYNYKVTPSISSSWMMCGSIGDGTVPMLIGLTMKIQTDMFFYGMGIVNALLLVILIITIRNFASKTSELKASLLGEEMQEIGKN